jgi:two-component system, chemotaxis family, sensor kinase CheA
MDDTKGYSESFFSEARANLAAMNAALLDAERGPEGKPRLADVFRAVHNVKGMSSMMGREKTAELCHALEDLLDALRKGTLPLEGRADALFRAFDALGRSVQAAERGEPEPDLSPPILELGRLAAGKAADPAPSARGSDDVPGRIDRIPVKTSRLDLMMNLAEELVVAKIRFDELSAKARSLELATLVDTLDRLASEIQYQVTQSRLVPLRLVCERFPRMARDLARRQGKEVALELEGGDLELDRRVAEEVGEALIHLLRNAVDHGVETTERRKAAGKPAHGTIRVAASKTTGTAAIEVSDDGSGLDWEAIGRAAAARGILPAGASKEELLEALVSGLSTSAQATEVSGRGLGLDIARRKTQSLGGKFSVESRSGAGTTFRMEIPLTLAIVKGLFVEVAGRPYAIPLSAVERIVAVEKDQVKGVLGREAAVVEEENIPLLRLRALFGSPGETPPKFPVVVVGRGRDKLGLAVDALASTQDIVLKPLNRLARGRGRFSGSTISGAGDAVLVLDVPGLLAERREGVLR